VVFREGWRVSDEDAKKLRDFHPEVVLVAPQIPPNTGTVARLCGALCTKLHLVEPLGFDVSEKAVRRAGLDYWDEVDITVHGSLAALRAFKPGRRLVLVETGGTVSPSSFAFEPGDLLVFGSETQGLPTDVLRESESNPNVVILTVPMYSSRVRSLNLANTVSMVVFAAVENLRERFLENRTGQSDCEGAGCPS
jgi:tRNA (cytidine/uridine-2'-O-)-methyltransferase